MRGMWTATSIEYPGIWRHQDRCISGRMIMGIDGYFVKTQRRV